MHIYPYVAWKLTHRYNVIYMHPRKIAWYQLKRTQQEKQKIYNNNNKEIEKEKIKGENATIHYLFVQTTTK